MMPDEAGDMTARLERFRQVFKDLQAEVAKVIVGQAGAVECLLAAVFSGGHVLLTGAPGLGRTLLVRTLADALDLTYNRIQFTPDLLPSDVIGTEVLEQGAAGQRHFRFFKGPVFCHLLLADEINRSPARTQAALLEAMHERQVTLGGQTHPLDEPFLVIATRNNMETGGVWRMPEAQIDRFMVAIELTYPTEDEEIELLRRTTSTGSVEVRKLLGPAGLVEMQRIATAVPVVPSVKRFALDIVRASRGGDEAIRRDVRLGASPRAGQAILRGAKVLAIVRGRCYVSGEDVRTMAPPVLEHRLMLDLRAASRGVKPRDVIARLVALADAGRVPESARARGARGVLKGARS